MLDRVAAALGWQADRRAGLPCASALVCCPSGGAEGAIYADRSAWVSVATGKAADDGLPNPRALAWRCGTGRKPRYIAVSDSLRSPGAGMASRPNRGDPPQRHGGVASAGSVRKDAPARTNQGKPGFTGLVGLGFPQLPFQTHLTEAGAALIVPGL
jgi:hypothetical protein